MRELFDANWEGIVLFECWIFCAVWLALSLIERSGTPMERKGIRALN